MSQKQSRNLSKLKPLAFMPLDNFHIVPIFGIEPDLIKLSAKKIAVDREDIKRSTVLNALANKLGFKRGFSGYLDAYENELLPFMNEHQLFTYQDLITPRLPGFGATNNFKHKRQDISERIFYSDHLIPEKIFTGYNFDYDQYFFDGILTLSLDIDCEKYGLKNLYQIQDSSNVDRALIDPDLDVVINNGEKTTRKLIDVVIGSEVICICAGFNLLGDQLVKPRKADSVFELYYSDMSLKEKELFHYNKKMELFVKRINELNIGWVEVIPFNNNLVFLKGENGAYDFIFKDQRDQEFKHQLYLPYLKRADIPKFDDEYHFKRWFYFEFKGNRKLQCHLAETQHYLSGGTIGNYPGIDELLKKSLYKEYNNTLTDLRTSIELNGFHRVELKNGKNLLISDLITISDFRDFLGENPQYVKGRVDLTKPQGMLDNLDSVNEDNDINLPVSLTWYDVMAFISWFNRKHKVETRLVTLEEYLEISPFKQAVDIYAGWTKDSITGPLIKINSDGSFSRRYAKEEPVYTYNLAFYDKGGEKIVGHPPYMEERSFQELLLKYESIEYTAKHNLKFMKSTVFGEWLLEKTCIRSDTLTSFYGDNYVLRSQPPLHSSGKYKGMKIGFRLCCELHN
ncbi:hypothetical protein [Acinetobacter sp. YH12075]|uniref:hypothetical protein n=1 Tax=Acinetobacter sp. YH12075 TaxID=2601070 RepID=UPI00211F1B2E|nr:hypothetical protein [Acinetobacter sp. YH12075]